MTEAVARRRVGRKRKFRVQYEKSDWVDLIGQDCGKITPRVRWRLIRQLWARSDTLFPSVGGWMEGREMFF